MLSPQAETVLEYIIAHYDYNSDKLLFDGVPQSLNMRDTDLTYLCQELNDKNCIKAIMSDIGVRQVILKPTGRYYFQNKDTQQKQSDKSQRIQRRHNYIIAAFGAIIGAIATNIDRIINFIAAIIS